MACDVDFVWDRTFVHGHSSGAGGGIGKGGELHFCVAVTPEMGLSLAEIERSEDSATMSASSLERHSGRTSSRSSAPCSRSSRAIMPPRDPVAPISSTVLDAS